MAQVTFTTLGNSVISNGIFSVRYVLDDNGTPKFVLRDIISDLGYSSVCQETGYWAKKFGRRKLYNSKRGQIITYATKEQVEEILRRSRKSDSTFGRVYRTFWENVVSRIETEAEIQRLKARIVDLEAALREREVA